MSGIVDRMSAVSKARRRAVDCRGDEHALELASTLYIRAKETSSFAYLLHLRRQSRATILTNQLSGVGAHNFRRLEPKLRYSRQLPTTAISSFTVFLAMASAAVIGSRAPRAAQRTLRLAAPSTRGLAAAASGSFQYETGNAGVQFASRDLPGATTTLAVVSKAGSRYQTLPGFSDALKTFAFKVSPLSSEMRSH